MLQGLTASGSVTTLCGQWVEFALGGDGGLPGCLWFQADTDRHWTWVSSSGRSVVRLAVHHTIGRDWNWTVPWRVRLKNRMKVSKCVTGTVVDNRRPCAWRTPADWHPRAAYVIEYLIEREVITPRSLHGRRGNQYIMEASTHERRCIYERHGQRLNRGMMETHSVHTLYTSPIGRWCAP